MGYSFPSQWRQRVKPHGKFRRNHETCRNYSLVQKLSKKCYYHLGNSAGGQNIAHYWKGVRWFPFTFLAMIRTQLRLTIISNLETKSHWYLTWQQVSVLWTPFSKCVCNSRYVLQFNQQIWPAIVPILFLTIILKILMSKRSLITTSGY